MIAGITTTRRSVSAFRFLLSALRAPLFAALLLGFGARLNAAPFTAVASTAWNLGATWGNVGNVQGTTYPGPADAATIPNAIIVTVNANQSVTSITFSAASTGGEVTVNSGVTLSVSAGITLDNSATVSTAASLQGLGAITCATITVGGINTPTTSATRTTILTSSVSTLTVSGALGITGMEVFSIPAKLNDATFELTSGSMSVGGTVSLATDNSFGGSTATLDLTGAPGSATLTLSGAGPFSTPGNGTSTFTPDGANATVIYSDTAAQTVFGATYNNLTLSGSGAKTTSGATIEGLMLMAGTATATGTAPAYGTAATLEYAGTGAQTTGIEFPATWSASGGVIIANTAGTVALNQAKIINANLTISNGATLSTSASNFQLTLGGSLFNSGTLNGNGSEILITGTAAQSIGSFSTTGLVDMTKTTGSIATLTGNVSAGTLTIDAGTGGGTLNLGSGLTVTVAGTLTMTSGTLNGGSSTLNLGGSVTGTGAAFSAGTGTVNYDGAVPQTAGDFAYDNLVFSGGGTTTIGSGTSVGGNMSIASGDIASVGTGLTINVVGTLTLGGIPVASGTWGGEAASGATFINTTYFAATTGKLNVGSGTASQLIVTLPGQTFTSGLGNSGTVSPSLTAGTPFDIELTVVSGGGSTIVSSFSGTLTITYLGPSPSPGGNGASYTISVTFNNGQATLLATTLFDAQSTTITASDAPLLTGVVSSGLTINPASAGKLAFGQQPSTTTAGSAITPAVTVHVEDTYGNMIPTDTSSVTIGSGTTGFTGGTLTVNAVGGVATFSAIMPTTAGTANTLTASDASLILATSSQFTVNPSTATQLGFLVEPSNGSENLALAPAVKVELLDQYGNVATTSSASITLALLNNPGGATLGGNGPTVTSAGVATFALLINNSGQGYTLQATSSPILTPTTSTPFNITGQRWSVVTTGSWNTTTTWAHTSGGTAGAPVPDVGDAVTIEKGDTVTVNITSAVCASVQLGSGATITSTGELTFAPSGSPALTVSGNVAVGTNGNAGRTGNITFISGSTLTAGSLTLGGPAGGGSAPGTIIMTSGSTLTVNGTIAVNTATGNTWTPGGGLVQLTANNTLPATIFTTFNNLTVVSGATALGVALTIDGNLTNDSGATLTTGSDQLTLEGNFVNSGTFNAGNSTIILTSTAAQSIAGFTTGGTLEMTKTGNTATLGGNVTAAALLINGSGGTLDLGSGLTHTITGTWTMENGTLNGDNSTLILNDNVVVTAPGGTFTPNTGTVEFTAGNTLPASVLTSFNNLTIESATTAMGTSISVGGALTLTGGVLSIGANTLTLDGTVSQASGTLTGGTSSSIIFSGTVATTLPAVTLNLLTINDASGITLGGNVTAGGSGAGTLTLTSGALTLGGSTLSVASGSTISRAAGSLSGTPSFGSTVNVTYTGSTAVTTGTEIPTSTTVLENLTINNSGGVTLGANATVNGTLTIGSGAILNGGSVTLSIVGASVTDSGSFVAGSGTVAYVGGTQTIAPVTYNNLIFSGTASKTMGSGTSVGGNLSIAPLGSSAKASITGGLDLNVFGSLTLGGTPVVSGTWGSTTATSAVNQNNTYFAATTGYLTVAQGSSTELVVTLQGQTFKSGTGNTGTVSGETAGNAFPITLTAVDALNDKDTTFTGSKTVTYSGPGNSPNGSQPSYITTVTFTAGQVTGVSTTLVDAQTTQITADTSGLTAGTSANVVVSAGTANQLAFTIEPGGGAAGLAWGTQPAVTMEDTYGNTVTGTSQTVTLAIQTNPGGGTLGGGTLSKATVSGVATFSGLEINKAGIGYTLTATGNTIDTTAGTVVSSLFNIGVGSLAGYTVTSPASLTRGVAFTITVTAVDAGGNTITTDSSIPVTMNDTTGNAQFTGSPATPVNGVFTMSVIDDFFESDTLIATDPSHNTGSDNITINALSGDYRSDVASGNWSAAGTWQVWSGSSWGSTLTPPPPNPTYSGEISVQGGDTVILTTSVNIDDALFLLTSNSTVSLDNGAFLTIGNGVANGTFSGGGGLVEVGADNTLGLYGNNTFTGGTTINAGTIAVTNAATGSGETQNLGPAGGTGITFENGGTLQDLSAVPVANGGNMQIYGGNMAFDTGGGMISQSGDPGNTIQLTGQLSGGDGLTNAGSDLVLNRSSGGDNGIGPITVLSGRLFVDTLASIFDSSITVGTTALLDFEVSGVNPITLTSANPLTFASGAGLSTREGALDISTANVNLPKSGLMIFDDDDQTSQNINISGNYPLTGALTIQVGGGTGTPVGTVTFSGVISGASGSINKTSTSELELSGANTYADGTTVTSGELDAHVAGSLGTGDVYVANNATLQMDVSSTMGANSRLILQSTATTVNLTTGGTQTIHGLSINNGTSFEPVGTYGASLSSASTKITPPFTSGDNGLISVSVNPVPITVTAQFNSKVYDATTTAAATPIRTSGSLDSGDTLITSETYTTDSAGTADKTVVPTAIVEDSGGFNVSADYVITPADNIVSTITPKPLTIAGLSVPASKVYDSTETATVSGTAALQTAETPGTGTSVDGIPYSSDNIMLSGSPIGTYNSPTVAGATTVTISGLSLAGTQVADYSLVPDAFSATITRLPITLTGSRTYNNTAIAKASILTISDDLDGLNLTLSGQATLLSASTGVEPIINFASLSLGGSAENNYTLTGASGSVTILPGGPPVANATNIYHAVGTAIQISVTNLLFLSTSDTNGDPVDLVSVAGGLLTNDSQIAITTNGSSVYYANPYQNSSYIVLGPANNNLTTYVSGETIQYVVEDGNFKTPLYMATNYINIIVTNAAGQGTGSIAVSGGSVVLSWAGIPYTTNVTQRSSLMNGPWTNIFTNIVPQAGLFTNIDTDPPQPTAFYQLQQY